MVSCLTELTHLNLNFINSGNTNLLYMILSRNSWNRKSELVLDISISINKCSLQYMMRA